MTEKKVKVPEDVKQESTKKYYQQNGNQFIEEGTIKVGYRYDQVEKRKMRQPNGYEFVNNVTLSQPSSEVLTLLKDGEEWYLVMGRQSRSPYVVSVDGELYSKIFLENAAGLLEEGQNFIDAASAEVSQELGAKPIYLGELIAPKLYRHVSYTDEVSKLYVAVAERIGAQNLDKEENILVQCIPLAEAEEEYGRYISGQKPDFFGFDIPDVTMLSLSIFFWKINTKTINLDNIKGTFGRNLLHSQNG